MKDTEYYIILNTGVSAYSIPRHSCYGLAKPSRANTSAVTVRRAVRAELHARKGGRIIGAAMPHAQGYVIESMTSGSNAMHLVSSAKPSICHTCIELVIAKKLGCFI